MPHALDEPVTPWPEVDRVRPDAVIDLPVPSGVYPSLKPWCDIAAAVVLAVPALPLIFVTWCLVRLTSAGPGFYTQTRSGLAGRPYRIYKLRTMRKDAEARSGIQWSQRGDSRVTPVGRFLRATHLDELPQLLNVLRGEMSLVGPRPERPEVIESKGLARQVPGYEYRLDVKPGVTGLAQVQLPPDTTVQSVRHKVAYDLYYIRHRSLWLDVKLIAATLAKTVGLSPTTLRRLFALPDRAQVGGSFRQMAVLPPPSSHSLPSVPVLQTA